MAESDKKGQEEQRYRSVSGLRLRGQFDGETELGADALPGERSATPGTLESPEASGDHLHVARLLDEAAQWMVRVAQGPLRQQLQQMLDRYRRTVRQWEECPPSDAQRAILLKGTQILRSAIARATLAR